MTLNELREAVNALADQYSGDLPVDIGIATSESSWSILGAVSVDANSTGGMKGPRVVSVRIYSELLKRDILTSRPARTRRGAG